MPAVRLIDADAMQGRDFRDTDRPGTPEVAIINEILARKAFSGENPLGKRIRIGTLSDKEEDTAPWLTVIGVIGNMRSMRYNHTDWEVEPAIYTAFLQRRDPKDAIHSFETQTIYVFLRAQVVDSTALATAARIHADPRGSFAH